MIERIESGIPGFDKVIEGGLISNSVNLLSGGAGTGKTIFGLQFIIHGAREHGEKGVYFSFEESERDLVTDLEGFGFSLKGLEDKIKLIYIPLYNIGNFPLTLKEELETFKPKRVVIDSISALAMPMEDDFERRKQIFKVREILKNHDCTSFLISEVAGEGGKDCGEVGKFSTFDIEEFVCDSVIVLHYAGIGGEGDRAIRVVKMRRTNHARSPLPMTISKQGMKVLKSKF